MCRLERALHCELPAAVLNGERHPGGGERDRDAHQGRQHREAPREQRAAAAGQRPESEARERARQREQHLLRTHDPGAEAEAAAEEPGEPSPGWFFRPGEGARQQAEPAQEEGERRHVGTDLQRLLDDHRLRDEEQRRQQPHPAPRQNAPQDKEETRGQRGQRQRNAAREDQKVPGVRGRLVDREQVEERRQREVVPGRVMLEEVPIGKHPPEHAPGRVRMLELVRVEAPDRDGRDARDQEAGDRDQDEAVDRPPRGPVRGTAVLVGRHPRSSSTPDGSRMGELVGAAARSSHPRRARCGCTASARPW
jgi:hypothetical protein